MPESPAKSEPNSNGNSVSSRMETVTIQEDTKEGEIEDEEGLTLYPYERLTTSSTDPASDIDILKREVSFLQLLSNKKFKFCFLKMFFWGHFI